jgi:hypothetical protein
MIGNAIGNASGEGHKQCLIAQEARPAARHGRKPMPEDALPAGYTYTPSPSAYINHMGKVYQRRSRNADGDEVVSAALRIEDHHVNTWGLAHGSLMAGTQAWRAAGSPRVDDQAHALAGVHPMPRREQRPAGVHRHVHPEDRRRVVAAGREEQTRDLYPVRTA